MEVLNLEDKAIKPAAFSTVRALLIFAALAIAISSFVYIVTDGAQVRQLFVSTEGVADMKKSSDAEIILEYKADDFYAYFLKDKNVIDSYSMIKKLGLWVFHYPSTKNPQGITLRGDDLYFYRSVTAEQAESVNMLTPQGDTLVPVAQTKIQVAADSQIAFVFKIEDYSNFEGDYLLQLLDANGNVLTSPNAGLLEARFTLIEDEQNLAEFAKRKYVEKSGENQDLWPLLVLATEKSISEKALLEEEFDFEALPFAVQMILADIDQGWHLTIYNSKEYYVWRDLKSYQVLLHTEKGSLLIETDQDYRQINGAEDVRSLAEGIKKEVYQLTSVSVLEPLFEIFKP